MRNNARNVKTLSFRTERERAESCETNFVYYQQCSVARAPKITRFGPNWPAADMEGNGSFEFWGFLETLLRIFEEFWGNWFVVRKRIRTSDLYLASASWKFLTTNKKFDFGLQMTSEVRFDLRFGICGPNCICNYVCFGCLGLFLDKSQNKIKKEQTHNLRSASRRRWKKEQMPANVNEKFVPSLPIVGSSDDLVQQVKGKYYTNITLVPSSKWKLIYQVDNSIDNQTPT